MAAGTGFAPCQSPGAAAAARWPLRSELILAALVTAPGCARDHVRAVLHEWGLADRAETAVLLVSELVTNAVLASDTLRSRNDYPGVPVCQVRLFSDRSSVLVSVWDGCDDLPVPRVARPDSEGGRGLMLVESLSQDWGAHQTASGKVVWVWL